MRIVRISTINFIESADALYRRNPAFSALPYAEQKHRLDDAGVGYGDAFARAMGSLGHEAFEIMGDFRLLQAAWARERGLTAGPDWKIKILLSQLRELKPEVVYFQGVLRLPPAFYRTLKVEVPGLRRVLAFKGAPGTLHELEGMDLCFAATPHIAEELRRFGIPTRVLYHAFDTAVPDRLKNEKSEPRIPVSFVGSSGYNWGFNFQARYWMLDAVLRAFKEATVFIDEREDLSLAGAKRGTGWSPVRWAQFQSWDFLKRTVERGKNPFLQALSAHPAVPAVLRRMARQILLERRADEKNRSRFPEECAFASPRRPPRSLRRMYPDQVRDAVYGLDMLRVLRRSLITLNRHSDAVAGDSGNMRLFEATGMGACLVTDRGDNLGELFEENKEVMAYGSTEECVEKVRYLLDHPEERAKIAAAGQARTLRDHTVKNRCQIIDAAIRELG